jgi:PST family polysaccharide transporter
MSWPAEGGAAAGSLRGSRAGAYLAARYGLSTLVNLGNMFVLTWWIGPRSYGLFVTAVGLTTFLASLTRAGVDTYLVRCEETPDRRSYNTAFTLIFASSTLLVLVGLAVVPLLVRWYPDQGFLSPYLALLVTVPLIGLAGPPMARLERDLNFRAVAGIELGGQVVAFLAGGVLAWRGLGAWAPVSGHVLWQIFAFVAACKTARLVPRLELDRRRARSMVSFGLGYTTSLRMWQLRTLVNPLLVGRFAGAEGVAFVALAIRVAEGLSFVRTAAGRLAIAVLARLREDRTGFRRFLERSMELQVLVLGPLLCAFSLLGPVLVPRLLGERWTPALSVYPFIAVGVLVNSVYGVQAAALFVVGKQWVVTWAFGLHVALLSASALALVPRCGISGYGWAELVACGGYAVIHRSLAGAVGVTYGNLKFWVPGLAAAMFLPMARGPVAALLGLLLLVMAGLELWRRFGAGRFPTCSIGLSGQAPLPANGSVAPRGSES